MSTYLSGISSVPKRSTMEEGCAWGAPFSHLLPSTPPAGLSDFSPASGGPPSSHDGRQTWGSGSALSVDSGAAVHHVTAGGTSAAAPQGPSRPVEGDAYGLG